jgi:hypothetical protein
MNINAFPVVKDATKIQQYRDFTKTESLNFLYMKWVATERSQTIQVGILFESLDYNLGGQAGGECSEAEGWVCAAIPNGWRLHDDND